MMSFITEFWRVQVTLLLIEVELYTSQNIFLMQKYLCPAVESS